ncbi:MAG: cytidine deaminase [bacterium]
MDIKRLISEAKKARSNSYSPYSRFKVGAAVVTKKGNIYIGANIENASYGMSLCAEKVAIARAVSEGDSDITAIAVVCDKLSSPCGACRQVIAEFGKNIKVIMADTKGRTKMNTISKLLPDAFMLKRKR